MAKVARFHDKPARNLNLNPLKILQAVLTFVGKPFYLLLFYLMIGVLFVFYRLPKPKIPSHKVIYRARAKISFPKLTLPKISLPKVSFPKLVLPKITFNLKKLSIFLIPFFLLFLFWFFILKDLPSPKKLITRDQEVSTKIYDRNGVLLYKIYQNQNRTLVPLSQIPSYVRLATLAAEDAEFYSHFGFSIRGITRAITTNLKSGRLTGGSTITQQLVKNALLTKEKTLTRKIKELVLSVEVELTFSKDQILEMYLNEVSYGGTAYGIEEASRVYFGKDVSQLTLAEAALLAGLPQSPTKFSPFGANPDLAFERQKEVLHLMQINKFITSKEENEALGERITFAPNKTEIKAPHFVMYVKEQLVEKYGEEMVEKGGLEVTTTLDYAVQEIAEKAVKGELDKLSGLNVRNGAALVLKPGTGEVLAMVGSKDYFDTANDGNVNVTLRNRQPGSSIKVVNYAYALSHGYTPATILDDSPVSFAVPGQPVYSPKDYDGTYRGKLPLRKALAESRNIPAVKVLASYGVSKMIDLGQKMGITTWNDPSRFGLSLTLGGGEIKLIDLAKVYATLANYGRRPEISSIVEVKNYKGEVLEKNDCLLKDVRAKDNLSVLAAEAEENSCLSNQIIDPGVAFLLIDILRDNSARSRAFGLASALVIPGHPEVAVKTGTSNNLRDNLTLGFTQNFLVATWVGNNDNSPMARVASGVTGASPIWNKIMSELVKYAPLFDWPIPSNVKKVGTCSLTGTLPCEGCGITYEWFLEGTSPTYACSLETIESLKKQNEEKNKPGDILNSGAQTEVRP